MVFLQLERRESRRSDWYMTWVSMLDVTTRMMVPRGAHCKGYGVRYLMMSTAVVVLLFGLVLPAGAGNPSPVSRRVCHPDGLAQDPPVCWIQDTDGFARHLPNVFGGPSTLGQCNFGHPGASSGSMSRGHSCWSGSLFG